MPTARVEEEKLPWTGPYTAVASAMAGTAYQIRDEKGAVLRRKYHGGQLKVLHVPGEKSSKHSSEQSSEY